MTTLIIFIFIVWFIAFAKKLFFWVYLWQLKEYHVGRFRDHFQTSKGKSLIFNYLLLVKIFILLGIFFCVRYGLVEIKTALIYFVALVFLTESIVALKKIRQGTFLKPVLTRKVALILSTGFSVEIFILFSLFILEFRITKITALLLGLDIIAPIALSFLVLFFQPLAVILRNRIINQAKKKRAKLNDLLVIGVTGSYGKTSTKEFLAAILSEKFRVLKTKEHQNSEVGISQCILDELDSRHEIFVCEMGAYNKGGIKMLCDIAKPKIGVLTGINEQHMATFGSQEKIIKTKYELIESLPEDGTAFFNANNKHCVELYERTKIKKQLYGQGAGSALEENLEGAKAVARVLGMTPEEIARGCQKLASWQSHHIKKGVNGADIIDSTYSANPDGVMADLEYLKKWPAQRDKSLFDLRHRSVKKVIIMPCLIELGSSSKEVHRRIGKKIGEVCDLAIITT
ncbi:MAG: Mur ligase family protein, partial [Candidatus Nealsonbacteria bacterium]|nr:Mur ligase family protein [Candidatus Nealsonbacteria bacterium]